MVIWTTRLSKGKVIFLAILLGAVLAAAVFLAVRTEEEPEPSEPEILPGNADRVAYLQSWGWEVSPEPVETLRFRLPDVLTDAYRTYNDLQLRQGFDLAACCGKQLERVTYSVCNYPGYTAGVQANLYLCDDIPVAGDICCPGAGGFRQGLARPAGAEDTAEQETATAKKTF